MIGDTISDTKIIDHYTTLPNYLNRVPWENYFSDIKNVVIEQDITSIGAGVFENCQNLISVAIPDSVTLIGEYAFADHDTLKKVYIENVSVDKLTFFCDEEGLHGMCKAGWMLHLTTRGGIWKAPQQQKN